MPISFVAAAVTANVATSGWNGYLTWRQLKASRAPLSSLPPEMRVLTTPEDFSKAQAYTYDRARFSLVRLGIKNVLIDSLLVGSGYLGALWKHTGGLSPRIPIGSFAHSLVWGVACDLVETALQLPFDSYSTFVVEAKHGFNKTTLRTFILDRIKMFALNLCILRPITTALLRFVVSRFGASFPIYLCGGASVLVAIGTFVVPTLIMPLFNKFTPLADGEIRHRIERLAERVNFPLTKLYTMDGSTRSAHSNAFFYGFWKNKRIVLFDTLETQMDPAEIEAVVAHELGHWQHQHMLWNLGMMMSTILAFGVGASKTIFEPSLYTDFNMPPGHLDPIVGFDLFSLVYWQPVSEVLSVARSLVSRKFEFQADRFAADLGYSTLLRSGLIKMFKENAATLSPDWFYAACRYSHPPLRERLAALKESPQGAATGAGAKLRID